MTKQEVDQKYLDQANALEAEFFDIVDEDLPSQHRILKAGKSIDEFDQRHGEIWHNHEAELIEQGFMEAPPIVYLYETFIKEIIHPRRDTPIYVGYQVLEFNQELTQEEISSLETQMGKIVRKLP